MSVGVKRETPDRASPAGPRRPSRRLSLGHLAVAVAAILAFVANVAFLRSMDDSVSVVVAARQVSAGSPIGAGDLTTARLRADSTVLAGLVMSMDGLTGRIARRDLAAGELVGDADLLSSAAPDGLRSMALPIDPAHAAGGSIRVGDRVDLVDVDDQGVAAYVVGDAPVLAISEQATGALAGSGGRHIVVGLDKDQVLAVAEAIADGEVDVVVVTGAGDG